MGWLGCFSWSLVILDESNWYELGIDWVALTWHYSSWYFKFLRDGVSFVEITWVGLVQVDLCGIGWTVWGAFILNRGASPCNPTTTLFDSINLINLGSVTCR